MANTKSTQHEIDLTGGLNLNKFKADIKPYEGFNERNAPYYGGCLSPLYIKDDGEVTEYTKYVDGVKWETRDGKLYKNGEELLSFNNVQFIKTKLSDDPDFAGKNIVDFFDKENYVEVDGDKVIICFRGNKTTILGKYLSSKFIPSQLKSMAVIVIPKDSSSTMCHCYFNRPDNDTLECFRTTSDNIYYYGTVTFNTSFLGLTDKFIQIGRRIFNKERITSRNSDGTVNLSEVGVYYTHTGDTNVSAITYSFSYYYNNGTSWVRGHETFDSNVFDGLYSIGMELLRSLGENVIRRLYYPLVFIDYYETYGFLFDFGIKKHLIPDSTNYYYEGYAGVGSNQYELSLNTTTINGIECITLTGTSAASISWTDTYYNGSVWADTKGVNNLEPKICALGNLPLLVASVKDKTNTLKRACASVLPKSNSFGDSYSIIQSGNEEFVSTSSEIIHYRNGWRINSTNSGIITGISFPFSNNFRWSYNASNRGTNCNTIGTLLTSWGSIGTKVNVISEDEIVYYDSDAFDWVIISKQTGNNSFSIINDVLVINTTSYLNCILLKNNRVFHWGADSVNRFTCNSFDDSYFSSATENFPIFGIYINLKTVSQKYSAGQNINWLEDGISISSKKGEEIIVYLPEGRSLSPSVVPAEGDPIELDLYIDGKYSISYYGEDLDYSYPDESKSGTWTRPIPTINDALVGTTYPTDPVRYNLPLLFNVISGVLDTTIVNFGSNVSFFTIYYDNRQRYQYYSSSITEFEDFFVIQAQSYGIKNNKIYSIAYSGGTIQASQAVVSIEGLQFVGNTIYNAYFYSPTTKAIYSFGADNNLVVFAQADTFDGITGSSYLPGTSSIILGTPDCAYVLNEKFGIYRLNDIKNLRYASQKPDSVVLVLDDHAYEISYIDRDTTEDWEKIDIVCDTAFYGAGSNVVSVNDCWYVRITDPDHKAGEVKLAVSTLTDIGRSTETRTFKVKESDWDELTDTIYIRFQPKLQRAVGVSLHIESPFKIGYIGVGATPETLQLNKGTI